MAVILDEREETMLRRYFAGIVAIAIGLAGCQQAPPVALNTGSNEAVTEFFEAIVRKDWPRGLAALASDKNNHMTVEQFGRQGEAYRKYVGFEPEELHIRSCEEQGSQAIAHVVLVGHFNGRRKQFRESVALRLKDGKWGVLKPKHF
jgi:hypothetical protein